MSAPLSNGAKRVFDLVAASGGMLMLSPLLATLGGLVWAADGRPVFFRQNRVGRFGQDFTLYKFRTMRTVAGSEKGSFEPGDGRRISTMGRWLRRTKLDELPQLLNVVRGDMSLVGPRPEVRCWVDCFPERWARVLEVRPGITDPASLEYRNEESILARSKDPEGTYRNEILPRKLTLYEQYVDRRSFCGDFVILMRTLAALIGRDVEQ